MHARKPSHAPPQRPPPQLQRNPSPSSASKSHRNMSPRTNTASYESDGSLEFSATSDTVPSRNGSPHGSPQPSSAAVYASPAAHHHALKSQHHYPPHPHHPHHHITEHTRHHTPPTAIGPIGAFPYPYPYQQFPPVQPMEQVRQLHLNQSPSQRQIRRMQQLVERAPDMLTTPPSQPQPPQQRQPTQQRLLTSTTASGSHAAYVGSPPTTGATTNYHTAAAHMVEGLLPPHIPYHPQHGLLTMPWGTAAGMPMYDYDYGTGKASYKKHRGHSSSSHHSKRKRRSKEREREKEIKERSRDRDRDVTPPGKGKGSRSSSPRSGSILGHSGGSKHSHTHSTRTHSRNSHKGDRDVYMNEYRHSTSYVSPTTGRRHHRRDRDGDDIYHVMDKSIQKDASDVGEDSPRAFYSTYRTHKEFTHGYTPDHMSMSRGTYERSHSPTYTDERDRDRQMYMDDMTDRNTPSPTPESYSNYTHYKSRGTNFSIHGSNQAAQIGVNRRRHSVGESYRGGPSTREKDQDRESLSKRDNVSPASRHKTPPLNQRPPWNSNTTSARSKNTGRSTPARSSPSSGSRRYSTPTLSSTRRKSLPTSSSRDIPPPPPPPPTASPVMALRRNAATPLTEGGRNGNRSPTTSRGTTPVSSSSRAQHGNPKSTSPVNGSNNTPTSVHTSLNHLLLPELAKLSSQGLDLHNLMTPDGVPLIEYVNGIKTLYDRLKDAHLKMQRNPKDFIVDDVDERPPNNNDIRVVPTTHLAAAVEKENPQQNKAGRESPGQDAITVSTQTPEPEQQHSVFNTNNLSLSQLDTIDNQLVTSLQQTDQRLQELQAAAKLTQGTQGASAYPVGGYSSILQQRTSTHIPTSAASHIATKSSYHPITTTIDMSGVVPMPNSVVPQPMQNNINVLSPSLNSTHNITHPAQPAAGSTSSSRTGSLQSNEGGIPPQPYVSVPPSIPTNSSANTSQQIGNNSGANNTTSTTPPPTATEAAANAASESRTRVQQFLARRRNSQQQQQTRNASSSEAATVGATPENTTTEQQGNTSAATVGGTSRKEAIMNRLAERRAARNNLVASIAS